MDTRTGDTVRGPAYIIHEFERRAYPLSDGVFRVGRDATSDIVIREPAVSRAHAEVRSEAGEYVVHTTGATSTLVNGTQVTTPRQLSDGDRLTIGSAELTFTRSKLPLGVTIVDAAAERSRDEDVLTKRTTIANPILGAPHESEGRRRNPSTLVLFVLAGLAAAYYFLMIR
jgi:pSer/pThr/pTyr-binding forkhead associated (FHA) protein